MAQTDRAKRRSKKSRKHALQSPHSLVGRPIGRDETAISENGLVDGTLETPHWNGDLREWTFLGRLVKRFRQPADSQGLVLVEFERRHWHTRIDNPLPHRPGRNRKKHMRATIENLNRYQHFRGIEVFADGTGQGICWRPRMGVRRATAKPL
jgi:hypothetical protein